MIFSLFKRKRIIKMQEGIKIKSKDINFFISIFYLAINLFIDILIITQKLNLLENYFLDV
tara:strand:- start:267 stop:446 length:180 start_codon:yes stop_codon:yes gene_type:complete